MLLASSAAAEDVVLELVRHLDLHYDSAPDEAARDCVHRALARAAHVTAPLMAAQLPYARASFEATAAAALAHLTAPSDETAAAFFEAATASYPFGPGEGCLAVEELGGHDTPGAGCASGAGFLHAVACVIGADALLGALRNGGLW